MLFNALLMNVEICFVNYKFNRAKTRGMLGEVEGNAVPSAFALPWKRRANGYDATFACHFSTLCSWKLCISSQTAE